MYDCIRLNGHSLDPAEVKRDPTGDKAEVKDNSGTTPDH